MGLDRARNVSNLHPLVIVTCERAGDARESHCTCQQAGCAVLRVLNGIRKQHEVGLVAVLTWLCWHSWRAHESCSSTFRYYCSHNRNQK